MANILLELAAAASKAIAVAGEAGEAAAEATNVVSQLEVDETEIAAGQAATVSLPEIGGSIGGVAGKFTGTVTFTPNAATTAPSTAAPAGG